MVKIKECSYPTCHETTQPFYGYEDYDWERCEQHKMPSMIRLDPQCAKKHCQYLPEFGVKDQTPRHCKFHKTRKMVQKLGCLVAKCSGSRDYGYHEGQKQYCKVHKLEGMVLVEEEEAAAEVEAESEAEKAVPSTESEIMEVVKQTEQQTKELDEAVVSVKTEGLQSCRPSSLESSIDSREDQHSQATPNQKGLLQADLQMVKVEMEEDACPGSCQAEKCSKAADFGFEDGPTRFCQVHKLDGMVLHQSTVPSSDSHATKTARKKDVIRCKLLGCLKKATYGFSFDALELCEQHKLDGMLYHNPGGKKKSQCHMTGCGNKGLFGWKNEAPTACAEHKVDGMVQRRARKQMQKPKVENRAMCQEPDCAHVAQYGFDNVLISCKKHKTEDMAFVLIRKRKLKSSSLSTKREYAKFCQIPNCNGIALYAHGPDGEVNHCVEHKDELSVQVLSKHTKTKCEIETCVSYAQWGLPDQRAQFCRSHARDGMVVKFKRKMSKKSAIKKCEAQKCPNKAIFAEEGGSAQFCADHKVENMVYVGRMIRAEKRCKIDGCVKLGSFGYEKNPCDFCVDHKKDDMLFRGRKLKPKQYVGKKPLIECEHPGCPRKATFGYIGERLQFCSRHALTEMEFLSKPRKIREKCKEPGCLKRAHYGYENGPLEFCFSHQSNNMLFRCKQKLKRTCATKDCPGEPVYGFTKSRGTRYCFIHKLQGMVAGENMCKHEEGCSRIATYGYKEAPKLRCFKHKIEGMISTKKKTAVKFCRAEGCTTTPSYGTESDPRLFCVHHKKPGMIHNGQRGTCENSECQRHPYYGFPGEKTRFCSIHKLDGMEARHGRKKCEYQGCSKQPTYGYQGKVRQFCNKHKLDGMSRTSICQHEGCGKYPHYGNPGQSVRVFCNSHKEPWMVYHPKPGVPGGAAIPRRKRGAGRASGTPGGEIKNEMLNPNAPFSMLVGQMNSNNILSPLDMLHSSSTNVAHPSSILNEEVDITHNPGVQQPSQMMIHHQNQIQHQRNLHLSSQNLPSDRQIHPTAPEQLHHFTDSSQHNAQQQQSQIELAQNFPQHTTVHQHSVHVPSMHPSQMSTLHQSQVTTLQHPMQQQALQQQQQVMMHQQSQMLQNSSQPQQAFSYQQQQQTQRSYTLI